MHETKLYEIVKIKEDWKDISMVSPGVSADLMEHDDEVYNV